MANNAKILLLEDVEHLGRKGEIFSVKRGYARNFLLPRSLGIVADKNALAKQKKLQEERQLKAAEDRKEAEQVAVRLVETVLKIEVKVDQDGHMYGSVSANDLVKLLEEQANIVVEKRYIHLPHPLKTTGTHTVALKLKEGIAAQVVIKIFAEGTQEQAQQEEKSGE